MTSQRQFVQGVGVYSPWKYLDPRVQQMLTANAPKRKYIYKTGVKWQNGKLVPIKTPAGRSPGNASPKERDTAAHAPQVPGN